MSEADRNGSGSNAGLGNEKSGSTVRAANLQKRLADCYPGLLERYPIDDYIDLLDATPQREHYHYISPEVAAYQQQVLDSFGQTGLEDYNRATMLGLIDAFDERSAKHNYPKSIIDQFKTNFSRIELKIDRVEPESFLHTNDRFLKDFAICRQCVFPAGGAWIVDRDKSFSRNVLFTGGIRQFFRFLLFYLFVARGNAPLYLIHTHLDLLEGFNAKELEKCHARIAEMLERHPEVKGLYGSSWLIDPAIERVSPRHAYFRKQRQDNGAWVFRVGEDLHGGALETSATRRRLYEEGKYIPTAYLVVWTRKKMIDWARRYALEQRASGEGQSL